MTYLEIVNKVLRRLREDQVTSFSDDYITLIADFVSDAHREVLEAHDWSSLDQTITVELTASQSLYDLTETTADGGAVSASDTPPGDNSFLRFVADQPQVWYYDSDSSATGTPMQFAEWGYLEHMYRQDTSASGTPYLFSIQPDDVNPGFKLRVYPTPTNGSAVIRMRFHSPEALLDADSDATSRAVYTPWRPIVLGALYYALNERGEEIGEPGGLAEQRFYRAIAVAKERDLNLLTRGGALEFYRD